MKKILLAFTIMIFFKGFSQNADAIIGKWLKTNKEDLMIEVYKVNNAYNGKINRSVDKRKPIGFVMLENLKYNTKSNSWVGGKVHDPISGRTYNATAFLKSNNTLEVSGAILFFAKKRTFKRIK